MPVCSAYSCIHTDVFGTVKTKGQNRCAIRPIYMAVELQQLREIELVTTELNELYEINQTDRFRCTKTTTPKCFTCC